MCWDVDLSSIILFSHDYPILPLPPSLPSFPISPLSPSLSSSLPQGTMFKLHDYRWSVAIEAIIGRELTAFVVDNAFDRDTLKRIMSGVLRGQRGPDVIISRYTVRFTVMTIFHVGVGYFHPTNVSECTCTSKRVALTRLKAVCRGFVLYCGVAHSFVTVVMY